MSTKTSPPPAMPRHWRAGKPLLVKEGGKQQKILYMVTQTEWGGAQNYIFNLIGKLDKSIWEPSVAVGEDADSGWLHNLSAQNIPVHRLRHLKREINPWHDLLSGLELVKLFKKVQPDIVHLNSSKIGATGALTAKMSGVPHVVYTVHGFVFNEPLGGLRRKFYLLAERASSRFKDKIITVSEHDRIIGINEKIAPAGKFTTIHNGLDFDKLEFLPKDDARDEIVLRCHSGTKQSGVIESQDSRTKSGTGSIAGLQDDKTKLVGTIANLYTTKGLKYLVKSARAVLEKYPPTSPPYEGGNRGGVIFVVIGKGGQEKELRKRINSLGLEDKFFLVGEIEKASRLLKAFDVFCLPSLKEGLPYVLLEAGAAGLPIVATRVGGVLEIIEKDKGGLIVPPADSRALSEAIVKLLDNKKLAAELGQYNETHIREKFSLQESFQKTERVYNELLSYH